MLAQAAARAAVALPAARRRAVRDFWARRLGCRHCRPADCRERGRYRSLGARVLAHLAPPTRRRRAGGTNRDYIREEVLYRTALALGLDKDDTIVRRRLRQKMEFLFEDAVPVPQESELRAYLQAHAEKFRTQPLISFRQIFVSQSRGTTRRPTRGDPRASGQRLAGRGE